MSAAINLTYIARPLESSARDLREPHGVLNGSRKFTRKLMTIRSGESLGRPVFPSKLLADASSFRL